MGGKTGRSATLYHYMLISTMNFYFHFVCYYFTFYFVHSYFFCSQLNRKQLWLICGIEHRIQTWKCLTISSTQQACSKYPRSFYSPIYIKISRIRVHKWLKNLILHKSNSNVLLCRLQCNKFLVILLSFNIRYVQLFNSTYSIRHTLRSP